MTEPATHHSPHAERFPRLSAGSDDSARAADRHGPAGLSLLRLQPDRHAGLEYLEILAGKGSEETDKQLYKFQDHGGRWVGLRFDLTVPLARFAAQHVNELGMPLQAIPHRHGLAGREHAARPLPRVHAVRFRHHRHPLGRRRHRNRPGDPRSVAGDRLQRLHHPPEQPHGADGPAWSGSAWPTARRPCSGRWTSSARSGPRPWPRRWSPRPVQRRNRPGRVLRLSEIAGGNDEVLRQVEPLVAGSETGQAGVAKLKEVLDGVGGRRRAGRAGAARPVDRPRTGLLHRHGLRDFLGRPARHRQRLLRRALRQPGRVCSPRRNCRASGPRWGWTGCWRRWKSWA